MSIAFQAATAADSGTASSSVLTFPGTPSGQMLVAVYAFEGVGAGSGPWITSSVGLGWHRAFYQAPSASGCGLEVWNTLDWATGSFNTFNFAASYTYVGRGLIYTGQYFDGTTNPVRASASQSWSGDLPATPTIFAFQDELLLAFGADTLASPGFGTPTPSGSTSRFDSARSGFGTAEVTAADFQAVSEGTTGPFTWPATASPAAAKGATGVMAVKPAAVAPSPAYVLEASMPLDLDLPDGYVLTWAAIDPATGADVAGVKVSQVSIFGTMLGTGDGGGGIDLGPFMLVPGPSA